MSQFATQLLWSHYIELLLLKDIDEIKCYIEVCKEQHLGRNCLREKIRNNEYRRIPVGAHNRYGHPKDEVLETLRNSKIYRTDIDGSIEIKLNKNGYKIRTCPP